MTAKGLVTGADPGELWNNFKAYCIKNGYCPAAAFLRARPGTIPGGPAELRPDEPWKIKPN